MTCVERRRRDVRRCQLTQPQCCPAPSSNPSRPPPPPSMSVAGAGPGPRAAGLDLRRRARLAVLEGVGAGRAPQDASDRRCCRCPRPWRPPMRGQTVPVRPGDHQVRGRDRVRLRWGGPRLCLRLWTSAGSESGRFGFVAAACCCGGVDSCLRLLLSLPAALSL